MSVFTCISCRIAFTDGDVQRAHYKSDWHRYNLKRKVADLPAVTSEEFQRRVLQQRYIDEKQSTTKEDSVYCGTCRKTFSTPNALDNHLNSKKHKEREKTVDVNEENNQLQSAAPIEAEAEAEASDVEELDSDEWEEETGILDNPVDNNDCIFCSHHSRSLLKNVKHMTTAHSFFIPDIEYCTDLCGLLKYLAEKVAEGYMCLWCNEKGRTFHSAQAARQHMLDKGHCKMLHEGLALAEYVDFYDYSTSYPDAHNQETDLDAEVTVPELDDSDYQLVLPSGMVVGHRSLMRYYKQNLNPSSTLVIADKNSRKLHKVLIHYKSLGWSAMQGEATARKARDVHYMKRMQAKYTTKLSIKANKLQKHFRQQVNF